MLVKDWSADNGLLTEPYLYKKNPLTDLMLLPYIAKGLADPNIGTHEVIPNATVRYRYPVASQGIYPPAVQQYYFEKIAILVDGTCGSAASLFPSKMRYHGKALLVSVGGLIGQPLETSSYAGGNVLDWDTGQSSSIVATYISTFSSIYYCTSTGINTVCSQNRSICGQQEAGCNQLSDAIGSLGSFDSILNALPQDLDHLPTSARMRANLQVLYLSHSTVPRQFTRMEGDVRLSSWLMSQDTSQALPLYLQVLPYFDSGVTWPITPLGDYYFPSTANTDSDSITISMIAFIIMLISLIVLICIVVALLVVIIRLCCCNKKRQDGVLTEQLL